MVCSFLLVIASCKGNALAARAAAQVEQRITTRADLLLLAHTFHTITGAIHQLSLTDCVRQLGITGLPSHLFYLTPGFARPLLASSAVVAAEPDRPRLY